MRITEAMVDDQTRRRVRRPAAPRLPVARASVVAASYSPVLSLALIIGGAGAVLAPGPVPFSADVLAIGAIAVGGWLLARRPIDVSPEHHTERLLNATLAERQEVIRASLALASISGNHGQPELARRARAVADAVEPREDGGPDGAARRAALHAVPGAPTGETLDPGADTDALVGAR